MAEATGIADRRGTGGGERARLLEVLQALRREVEGVGGLPREAVEAPFDGAPPADSSEGHDQRLLGAIMDGLAGLASSGGHPRVGASTGLDGALEGVRAVARGEILSGHADRMPLLLPGFVYKVLSPTMGPPEAARVADRAVELLHRPTF